MSVPQSVRNELRTRLWKAADEIGWTSLSATEKKLRYENWSRDPAFGGTLARYMDNAHVRVYIKDAPAANTRLRKFILCSPSIYRKILRCGLWICCCAKP